MKKAVSTSVQPKADAQWTYMVLHAELGDLTDLPSESRDRIVSVYQSVASAYLGWRRIQAGEKETWLPETGFDPALLGELSHFYSDYQRPIQQLQAIRRIVPLLRSVDPRKEPEAHQQLLRTLTDTVHAESRLQTIMKQLVVPNEAHAAS